MTAILSDFLIIMICISVVGCLFHMLSLILCRRFRLSSGWQYILCKAVLYFYLIAPLFTIMVFTVNAKPELIAGMGEEFCTFIVVGLPISYYFYEYYHELDFIPYAFALWVSGTVLFFCCRQIKGSVQLRCLKKHSREDGDDNTKALCRQIAAEYQIHRSVRVFCSELISSPFIAGIRNPVIFLPRKELLEEELEFILRHEMIHCRQKDILYKQFLHMVKSLYWFNPVIYLFVQSVDDCCELACDEILLAGEGGGRRKEYARCILRFAGDKILLDQTAGISSGKMIERRISAIADMGRKRCVQKRPWWIFLLLICLFFLLVILAMAGSMILRLSLAEWMEAVYFQPVV